MTGKKFTPDPKKGTKKAKNEDLAKCRVINCFINAVRGALYCPYHNEKIKERYNTTKKNKVVKTAYKRPIKISKLVKLAETKFNTYIRLRDKDLPCISCGRYNVSQWHAGHFWSGGKFKSIKFDPDNVHKQCLKCNYYGGVEVGAQYRKNLIKKIGIERVEKLDMKAGYEKRNGYRYERIFLESIIEKYKQ